MQMFTGATLSKYIKILISDCFSTKVLHLGLGMGLGYLYTLEMV